jgi:hypothetical protein
MWRDIIHRVSADEQCGLRWSVSGRDSRQTRHHTDRQHGNGDEAKNDDDGYCNITLRISINANAYEYVKYMWWW